LHLRWIHVGRFGGNQIVILLLRQFVEFPRDTHTTIGHSIDSRMPPVSRRMETIQGFGLGRPQEFGRL
jgi:hypothetical protein